MSPKWLMLAMFVLSTSLFSEVHGANRYCKLKCGKAHTMCKYRDTPGENCKGYITRSLTQKEKDYLVQLHNEERDSIAQGNNDTEVLGLPQASNMLELEWDTELEKIASRWAEQCILGHDQCRDSERFYVGQNMAYYATTAPIEMDTVLKEAVQGWNAEIEYVNETIIENFQTSPDHVIGHFTQVVWATTKYVGCALAVRREDEWKTYVLFCNYGAGGNWYGEPVYRPGDPCSNCPEGTSCSTTYTSLCAPE